MEKFNSEIEKDYQEEEKTILLLQIKKEERKELEKILDRLDALGIVVHKSWERVVLRGNFDKIGRMCPEIRKFLSLS